MLQPLVSSIRDLAEGQVRLAEERAKDRQVQVELEGKRVLSQGKAYTRKQFFELQDQSCQY